MSSIDGPLRGWMPWRSRALAALMRQASHPVDEMTPEQIKRVRAAKMPLRRPFTWITGPPAAGVDSRDERFVARDGHRVRVRVHVPRGVVRPLPVVLHLHGGGFVIGNIDLYDPFCSRLAAEAEVVVVTVNYRKGPEFRAPLAPHDCIDAAEWVLREAERLGVDPDRIGVAGDSAGGNLAAVVAQHLRDEGVEGLRHQALMYPAPDLTVREVERIDEVFPVLTPAMMLAFRGAYLDEGDEGVDWFLSPARGRLDGLPPALVQTAELDPLRDDGAAYAEAMRAAGVEVRLTNYLGAPHGFATFPGVTSAGEPAFEELTGEVRHYLHRGTRPAPDDSSR